MLASLPLRPRLILVLSYGHQAAIGRGSSALERYYRLAQNPSRVLWLIDMTRESLSFCHFGPSTSPFSAGATDIRVDFRHKDRANGVFLDGSVRSFQLAELAGSEAFERVRLR